MCSIGHCAASSSESGMFSRYLVPHGSSMPSLARVALCSVLFLATSLWAQSPADGPSRNTLKVFDSSLVDTTVNPCENFYKFSCNGWLKNNPLPKDETSYA